MAQANSQNAQKKTITDKFIEFSLNYIPDSMVFVLGLTVFVFVLALIFTDSTPWGLVEDYAKGFWELLSFSMQMCLMMISGFVIANAKPIRRGIVRLIDWPKTRGGTIALFALITGVISWLHWGVGLMATIIMGKEIAIRKRGQGFHYAFIVAMAYTSMNIMANGISQAAPLLSATPGNFMEKIMGGIVPISQTSLSPYMMTFLVLELLLLPVIYYLLMPKKEKAVEISDELYKEFTAEPEKIDASKKLTPAERWGTVPRIEYPHRFINSHLVRRPRHYGRRQQDQPEHDQLRPFWLGLIIPRFAAQLYRIGKRRGDDCIRRHHPVPLVRRHFRSDYFLRLGRRNYGAVYLHRDAGDLSVDRIHLHRHHGLLRPVGRV